VPYQPRYYGNNIFKEFPANRKKPRGDPEPQRKVHRKYEKKSVEAEEEANELTPCGEARGAIGLP
jgi:hypothetical protein